MTDSFADLWSSTAPSTSKQAEPQRKLGAIPPTSTTLSNRTNDIFSLLSAAGPTSATTSRSTTPSHTNIGQTSRSPQPVYVAKGSQHVQKTTSSGAGDAFSGLLSGSFASSADSANMTIAERAALVERQKSEQLLRERQTTVKHTDAAWAGLDSLAGTPSLSSTPSLQLTSTPSPGPSVPVVVTTSEDDDWLSDFAAPKPTVSSANPSSGSLLADLDDFTSVPSQPTPPEPLRRSSTSGDFDFGDSDHGLLNEHSDDEDDILGDLSKPVDQVRQRITAPSQPSSGQRSRASSPSPHILGQIVEMGFSVQQARIALAATDTGLDVQAALETLLASGAADSDLPPASREDHLLPRSRDATQEPSRRPSDDGRRRGQATSRSTRESARETSSPSEAETQRNLQEQADKLLAQASEIGLSVFNRANAFWREGKEKVQKAYEERAKASGSGSGGRVVDGRPKWMQDAEGREKELEAEWRAHKESGGFRNDDEVLQDEVLQPKSEPQERRAKQQNREPVQHVLTSSRAKTGNLLPDDTPAVYVSPFRRKTPSRNQTSPASAPPPKATSSRVPSPVQIVQRKTVSASPSALATSAKHKATGTEMFKLGRFAEAETSYSNAIAALPHSHLLLIPLYNNRALSRIKTGEHSGAIEDCTTVINLIGTSYHPAREVGVTKEEEGASVDLADAYVKALKRRAEAYEGKEKWDLAKADWEAIAGAEWAKGNVRGEAVRGVGRCRRMLTSNVDAIASDALPQPKPTHRVKPRPAPKVVINDSDALNRVREANQAAEAEDEQRYQLKDVVDAKLIAWKGGKENNIRALIASLETVLWPELGWQKVGMHELVTPNQVKIRYTKAIAKLHPDKLNVHNTTLEQRMIANGVFGSLNDAWNAFKQ
ncbi:unnamed protein product [Somion occarium]|uniref:UBA domain-containing protein n=1 Tax=Somion occarium TaxID=3059160 RepID=A0ABP1CYW9_9APHY